MFNSFLVSLVATAYLFSGTPYEEDKLVYDEDERLTIAEELNSIECEGILCPTTIEIEK